MRMTRLMILVSLCLACVGLMSCSEKAPAPSGDSNSVDTTAKEPESTGTPVDSGTDAVAAAADGLVPLPIKLPQPQFAGTPTNLAGVDNLEPPLGKDRPAFMAPADVTNVALDKPVTANMDPPIMGELYQIVDGDNEATEDGLVDLGPTKQWIVIDLEEPQELWAILIWHNHKQQFVYKDVVVQVADDPDFISNVRTLFNNDTDNTSGQGVGSDKNYVETAEGKLIDAKKEVAQYVRLWSNGNNLNDRTHYLEVQVFGRPAQ